MRVRMIVSYRGGRYAGWQVQPQAPSIQGELEAVVAKLTGEPARVTGASRTDAGVHAFGQVCHFDPARPLPPETWQRAFDRMLPNDIRVLACRRAADDFHARYDARGKTYCYQVDPAPIASPFLSPFSWHRPHLNDLDGLRAAASRLEGPVNQRVFAAHAVGDREERPVDRVTLDVGRLITITVSGRSFLRHAVRGMVGSILEVGHGRRNADDISAMCLATPGHLPLVKAPPQGLFLARVDYPGDREDRLIDAC